MATGIIVTMRMLMNIPTASTWIISPAVIFISSGVITGARMHNEVSDENLMLLRDYCSTINRRYEENVLFGRHLDYFITNFGFATRKLANDINTAFTQGTLVEYISPSNDNSMRMGLIYCLIGNLQARNKLLEMQRG